MGHGIAQVFATGGYDVCLNDMSAEILAKALIRIRENLRIFKENGFITESEADAAFSRIRTEPNLEEAVRERRHRGRSCQGGHRTQADPVQPPRCRLSSAHGAGKQQLFAAHQRFRVRHEAPGQGRAGPLVQPASHRPRGRGHPRSPHLAGDRGPHVRPAQEGAQAADTGQQRDARLSAEPHPDGARRGRHGICGRPASRARRISTLP